MSLLYNDTITKIPNNVEYDEYDTCKYTIFDDPDTHYDGIRLTTDHTANVNYNRDTYTKAIADPINNNYNKLVYWTIIKDNTEDNYNTVLRVDIHKLVSKIIITRHDEENKDQSVITIELDTISDTTSHTTQKTIYVVIKHGRSDDSNQDTSDIITEIHESYKDSHYTQLNNTPYNRQYNQMTTLQYNSTTSDYQDCQISISADYAKLWLGYDKE
jgi:hypothetical protein